MTSALINSTVAVTQHNVVFEARMMGGARDAIMEDRFPSFVRNFFDSYFGTTDKNGEPVATYPRWCVDALRSVGIDLMEEEPGSDQAKKQRLVIDGNGAKWEYSDLTNTTPRSSRRGN